MPSQINGLTSSDAKKRLARYGPNSLPEKPPPSDLKIFISQLKSPLVYILLLAGLVTLLLGHTTDTAIIAFAVFINTILGFLQERKANKSLYALKKLLHPHANVVRNGKTTQIPVEEVVPGDVCILNQGDKVPADGVLIKSNRLFLSEAILTGESVSVSKDEKETVFMGTIVTSGRGVFEVGKTGAETEMGKIALSVQEPQEDTPLRMQLTNFSKQLTYLVIILVTFVFVVGTLRGGGLSNLPELFTTSVALSVSSIPEGLLVGLTVVLAIGMQRILARKGLVRNLVSAETLGSVTTICVDKTGTLTEGKMKVVEVVGSEKDLAIQSVLANDLDDPVVIALWEWAEKKLTSKDLKGESIHGFVKKNIRVDSIPFSSKDRFFASLNKVDNSKTLFVNGAPEFLIDWSTLSSAEKEKIKGEIDILTAKGMRVVGLAKKKMSSNIKEIKHTDVRKNLEWVGVVALSDPVRKGVKEALAKSQDAGIKTIVITGDYAQTAVSVLAALDIEVSEKEILLGSGLKKLKGEALSNKLREGKIKLFARTTPEQKLKIVKALKKNGEVVAMMGDGVNDAPALNRADIGIVVGEASDVAKESADLVLLDSKFDTIVMAIEEGRGIFTNLRKIILYLMSDSFEGIIAVVSTIILGLPLPVTAAQILWINLISDGFPHLALTIDPKNPDIMKRQPRDPGEPLVNSWMKKLIAIVSLAGGIVALVVFVYILNTTGDILVARSVAFATLGANTLVYVFSIRTLEEPFWRENPFKNKWLNVSVIAGLFFQVAPFMFEAGRKFLGIVYIAPKMWFLVFSASGMMFILIEISKVVFRRHLSKSTTL